ncbi:histidine phosphatase family protein [Aquisalibacillus elongatus]|uniref:2,3-bisphosphoglycerate-dependent phosphoglycerate mutase n=1 Tax=Aquisalibacillus elongatus TaxID=485577 RepID=A0A3N5B462_9BACI|nr:histidine phosphatase family protein [Aquisalibacillus elongatus]RPF52194.1 2,3-bisphosphoglycerate-dependent phosphoglycerate mutase [Aquisalibacillus elongatus]
MQKNIYIIRHCQAEGQHPEAPLTNKGFKQADELSHFLSEFELDHVISSPFLRAVQTIRPYIIKEKMSLEIDERLSERVLSNEHFSDWLEKLRTTFNQMDLKYEGGESSNEAQGRIINVINEILDSEHQNVAIVTHGGIMSLLLKYYEDAFGFNEWQGLTRPDVYQLTISNEGHDLNRLWEN